MSSYINRQPSVSDSSQASGPAAARMNQQSSRLSSNIWDAFNRDRAKNINSLNNITNAEQLKLIDSKFDLLLKDTASLKSSIRHIERTQANQQQQIERIFSLFNLCDSHIIDILSPHSNSGIFSPDAAAQAASRLHPFESQQSSIPMSEEELVPLYRESASWDTTRLHDTGFGHNFAYPPFPQPLLGNALGEGEGCRGLAPAGPPIWSPDTLQHPTGSATSGEATDADSSTSAIASATQVLEDLVRDDLFEDSAFSYQSSNREGGEV